MTLSDFIEELNVAIRQDGHDIYCNASTAEAIKRCLTEQNRMNKDTISRQDAIDAFWKLEVELRPSAIDAVLDMLKNLPSAQPEIIRCKDCKWGREVCGNIECFVDSNIPPEYHGYEWFCPNGER